MYFLSTYMCLNDFFLKTKLHVTGAKCILDIQPWFFSPCLIINAKK